MNASVNTFTFEAATIGTCNHTRHRHGWWCVACLRRIAPSNAEVDHPSRGEWRVRIGPAEGFGVTRTKAWQAALEALLMAGQFDGIQWPDTVPCEGCGHPYSQHCPTCCWCDIGTFRPDLGAPRRVILTRLASAEQERDELRALVRDYFDAREAHSRALATIFDGSVKDYDREGCAAAQERVRLTREALTAAAKVKP